MQFTRKRHLQTPDLKLDGKLIESVEKSKYPATFLDEKLSDWKWHIDHRKESCGTVSNFLNLKIRYWMLTPKNFSTPANV